MPNLISRSHIINILDYFAIIKFVSFSNQFGHKRGSGGVFFRSVVPKLLTCPQAKPIPLSPMPCGQDRLSSRASEPAA